MSIEKKRKRALACLSENKLGEAKTLLHDICSTHKMDAESWFLLGAVNGSLGLYEEVIRCNRKAIKISPDYTDAYYNLAKACQETMKLLDAEKAYRAVLELNPGHIDAYNNLGNVLRSLGKISEALGVFEQALKINPNFAPAHCNYSLALLLDGEFDKGWQEFEWRWSRSEHPPKYFKQPQWKGEHCPEKTVFIHAEQGYGDTIQFLRYLPQLRERCKKVILQCQPGLGILLAHCEFIDQVIEEGRKLPSFDMHVPIQSLPGIFNTRLNTIPGSIPYIKAPDRVNPALERLFKEQHGDRKIGIVWSGNPTHVNDSNRSCDISYFRSLSQGMGLQLYSLQKGDHAELFKQNSIDAIDLGAYFSNFADTAYAVSKLDLVISVDTSVAHLAGALNIPTWLLLPFDPDWRWLLNRNDSPWYPCMRLFRQPKPLDWSSVFLQLNDALSN